MASKASKALTSLQVARKLQAPKPRGTRYAAGEDADWWHNHANLLSKAWQEWEGEQQFPSLDTKTLVDPNLRQAVKTAYQDHSKEEAVRECFSEVAPGVFKVQLFDPDQIKHIREYIDKASSASIPYKRPNSMNRYGLILHPLQTSGAVNIHELSDFYQRLFMEYVRPLGSLFFPEFVSYGDDTDSYAFTIRYKQGEDLKLDRHVDTSIFTVNVNLNKPGESYEGSTLTFMEPSGAKHDITFAPGMAVLHIGMHMHRAQPLVGEGERTNLVIWVRGDYGHRLRGPYPPSEQMTPKDRWTIPKTSMKRKLDQDHCPRCRGHTNE